MQTLANYNLFERKRGSPRVKLQQGAASRRFGALMDLQREHQSEVGATACVPCPRRPYGSAGFSVRSLRHDMRVTLAWTLRP